MIGKNKTYVQVLMTTEERDQAAEIARKRGWSLSRLIGDAARKVYGLGKEE